MQKRDARAVALLLALYAAEGLPYGLVLGSIPFLLKESASFAQVALFSLCAVPYALKLLVAPLVDGSQLPLPIGRRTSWIVPAMAGAGVILTVTGCNFDRWVAHGSAGVLTAVCFVVVALVALSEVALDGWTIEVLSEQARPYAALCQVLGPSIGYTSSFTVFLALNDAQLCDNHIWPALGMEKRGAAMSLSTAVTITGVVFMLVSAIVIVAEFMRAFAVKMQGFDAPTRTDPTEEHRLLPANSGSRTDVSSNTGRISDAYRTFLHLLQLPSIQQLVLVLLLCKLGFSSFDVAAPLKLVDYGFPKESIALIGLFQSLCQLLGSIAISPFLAQSRPELLFVLGYGGTSVTGTTRVPCDVKEWKTQVETRSVAAEAFDCRRCCS